MPITKITIENFKGIGKKAEIPLKPITLLFGANSSGKTTVLHALLYLRELLERQNADADRVIGGGKDVYLGGFRQLVHGHDESLNVKIGVEYTLDEDGCPPYPIQDQTTFLAFITNGSEGDPAFRGQQRPDHEWQRIELEKKKRKEKLRNLITNGIPGVQKVSVEVEVGIPDDVNRPMILSYEISINGTRFGEIQRDSDLLTILQGLETRHPIFSDANSEPVSPEDFLSNEYSQALEQALACGHTMKSAKGNPSVLVVSGSALPSFGEALDFDLDEPDDYDLRPLARLIISQLMVRPGELVRDHLRTYRHLGPIRAVPDLSSIAQRSPSPDRWIDGMAAWDLLSADAERTDSKRGEIVSRVNAYLQEENRLNLGYSLVAETVRDIPVDSSLATILERFVIAPEEFEGEAALKAGYAEILERNTRSLLQLIDLRRDVPVNPSDIGAGVSQVIPVLVCVLDSLSKVTAIEQPELHLHPAVQCSLGDLFIREANKNSDRLFFVESHSEHLLLRLMRRMRETHQGEEPSPDLALGPETMTIIFVETFEGRSVYREMPLNVRGELVKSKPGGFFEEDLNELI